MSFSAICNICFSSCNENSLLTLALFLICLALCPKRSVDLVSSSLNTEGEQAMINEVLELPPKDSCRRRVSFESLYGTWDDLPSVKAFITYPRAVKLLLMFWASVKVSPFAPVLLILSDPARSTRYILPVFWEKSVKFFYSTCKINTLCDLELSAFINVEAIDRFSLPTFMML